jgi:hypothetical protein
LDAILYQFQQNLSKSEAMSVHQLSNLREPLPESYS